MTALDAPVTAERAPLTDIERREFGLLSQMIEHADDGVPCDIRNIGEHVARWAARCPRCGIDYFSCDAHKVGPEAWRHGVDYWRCDKAPGGCGGDMGDTLQWRPI